MRLAARSLFDRSASAAASAAATLREALFPPVCPGCAAETGAAGLCPACWREIAFLDTAPGSAGCRYCARPIPGLRPEDLDEGAICDECLRWPPGWDRGRAAFRYEGTGRRLVLGLKHGDRLDMVPMLGGWLLRAGRELVAGADIIAPVPLHWTRRLKRRANQSAELARWLARARGAAGDAGGVYAPRLLLRTRRTPVQDGKGREARAANVEGAFALGPDAGSLQGKRVLLIDDVLTTGATLGAAARLCRQAGARGVDVLVLALVMREEFAYLPPSAQDEDADDEAD